jgi:MFS superfamily sulfate permease-like transporter
LRLGLLALVAIGIAGAASELAFERHWRSPVQLIPWVTLAVLVVALVMLALRDSPRTVAVVRVLALAVLLAAAYGVFTHASVNYGSGPADPAWDGLPPLTQWWYAFTKTVGDAPPLAPGMLAQSALLLVLATLTPKKPKLPS